MIFEITIVFSYNQYILSTFRMVVYCCLCFVSFETCARVGVEAGQVSRSDVS